MDTHTAAEALRSLLAIRDNRPGSWEADHVIALEHELRAVLDLLDEGTDLTNWPAQQPHDAPVPVGAFVRRWAPPC